MTDPSVLGQKYLIYSINNTSAKYLLYNDQYNNILKGTNLIYYLKKFFSHELLRKNGTKIDENTKTGKKFENFSSYLLNMF